jgi:hypothetical protein
MAEPTLCLVTAVFAQTAFRQAKLARRSLSGLLVHVPRSHIQQYSISDSTSFPVHNTDPTTIPKFRKCSLHTIKALYIYRMSQEEGTKLWESVPYVKIYRYNPKHLYPKLNGYGDNGQRKVWSSAGKRTVPVS